MGINHCGNVVFDNTTNQIINDKATGSSPGRFIAEKYLGSMTIARAMPTRFIIPPDISPGYFFPLLLIYFFGDTLERVTFSSSDFEVNISR